MTAQALGSDPLAPPPAVPQEKLEEIGRASCRERVCELV